MKLDANERSILAAFRTSEEAEQAGQQLRKLGFTYQVDRTSTFGRTPHDRELNNPIASEARTLTGLTLYSGEDRTIGDVGPLLAAHPAASGMSGPPLESRNFLLTVVGPADKTAEALQIIRGAGGEA